MTDAKDFKAQYKTNKNVTIIGAGPSGLMAAQVIAQAGHNVTIYDQMPTFGRKFMMAGRGGLNLTHSESLEKFITRYKESSNWLEPSIRNFPPEKLREWCENLGQETFVGSSGRVFPSSMKASPLLRSWLGKLDQLKVQYRTRHCWLGFDDENLIFKNETGQIIKVKTDATLLALGGASWSNLGSDAAWVDIVLKCGVKISPLRPSNCGFIVLWSEYFSNRFAGTPIKSISIVHKIMNKNSSYSEEVKGEIMITKNGIEGGAIYALSAGLRESIANDGRAILYLDLRPEMSVEQLQKKLQIRGKKTLSNYLRKAGLPPITSALLHELIPPNQLTNLTTDILAKYLKHLPITLTKTTTIERAISTAGGIMRESVDENFMLKVKSGIFVAGEMLDWEAPTGGYLLQGCFSTAISAAKGILRFIEK